MAISLEDFTMEEVETLEQLAGVSLSNWENAPSQAKAMTAMAYVAKQRQDPTFTYEQARKLTVREINELISDDSEDA